MKKFIVLILLLESCFLYGQNDNYEIKNEAVVVEKVINFDVDNKVASDAIYHLLVTKLNDSNETLKAADKEYYAAKILTPTLDTYSMGAWQSAGEVTIEITFREKRFKVKLECRNIRCWSNIAVTNYNPTQAAPISEKHDAFKLNIPKKNAEKTFNNLVSYMNDLMQGFENCVKNISAEEDW